MHDWLQTVDQIAERLSAPFNAVRLTLQPLEGSSFSRAAWAHWAEGRDVSDVAAEGITCGALSHDWGIPSFSALQLVCWLERNPDRMLPLLTSFYSELRDSSDRPDGVEPHHITSRLIAEAGIYSDGPLLGYDVLACVPELQIAFWQWWQHGVMPDVRVDGFSLERLVVSGSTNAAEQHPVHALLTLDWIAKDPDAARRSLARL